MDPAHWQRINDVFHRAIELSGAERETLLDRECGDDSQFRSEVESLLSNDGAADWDEPLQYNAKAHLLPHGETPNEDLFEPTYLQGDSTRDESRLPDFGDYQILEMIARGGMGVVYKAEQKSLGRVVALKLIRGGNYSSSVEISRFRSEATAAAGLQHPNIVAVHEVGTHEGLHYFSMDYVEGSNLAELIHDGPLDTHKATEYLLCITEAVSYSHQCGILHRDLKPSNILIDTEQRAKVSDFGLAKHLELDSGHTQTGDIIGTPSYMAPEQAAGLVKQIGPATDVYGLGSVLYASLTGSPPFHGGTTHDTIRRVINDDPIRPSTVNRSVNADLETICLKCLQKAPGDRYESAAQLAEDLRRYLDGQPILARPVGAFGQLVKWSRRKPAQAFAVVMSAVACLAFVGAAVAWYFHDELSERNNQLNSTISQLETTQTNLESANNTLRANDIKLESANAQLRLASQQLAEERDDHQRFRYAYQMNLAHRAWLQGQLPLMIDLIHQLSEKNARELRGFEWFYLERLTESYDRFLRPDRSTRGTRLQEVAYSANGEYLASAQEGRVVVWRIKGEDRHLEHYLQSDDRLFVAFSPDGKRLATSNKEECTILDLAENRAAISLPPCTGGCFGSQGNLFLGRTSDALEIWDVQKMQRISMITLPRADTRINPRVQISPDGKNVLLQIGKESGVWDVETGECRWTLPIAPALFLTDKIVLGQDTAFGGTVVFLNSSDGSPAAWADERSKHSVRQLVADDKSIECLARLDETQFATVGSDGFIKLWNLQLIANSEPTRFVQPSRIYRGHTAKVNCVAFNSDGTRLAAGCSDGSIMTWDPRLEEGRSTLRDLGKVAYGRFRPESGEVAISSSKGLFRWETDSLSAGLTDKKKREPIELADAIEFSSEGQILASLNTDGSVATIWDIENQQQLHRFDVSRSPESKQGIDFTGDDSLLAAVDFRRGQIHLHDTLTGELKTQIPYEKPYCVSCSPADPVLAIGGYRKVVVWNIELNEEVASYDLSDPVLSLAFSGDGRFLAAGMGDSSTGSVVLWDLSDLSKFSILDGHAVRVTALAFTPDGRRLASGDMSGQIKVWDTASGQETLTLSHADAHPSPWLSLDFSPDGHRLLGTTSNSATIWDARPAADLWARRRHRMIAEQGVRDLSPQAVSVFQETPRHEFFPYEHRRFAYTTLPLRISGNGLVLSQFWQIRNFIRPVELQSHHRVLEIGHGTAYLSAILSQLCESVYKVEADPGLADSGRRNLARLGYENVQIRSGDGLLGWPEAGPFDCIFISRSLHVIPDDLLEQLKPGGFMVVSIGEPDYLRVISKDSEGNCRVIGKGARMWLSRLPSERNDRILESLKTISLSNLEQRFAMTLSDESLSDTLIATLIRLDNLDASTDLLGQHINQFPINRHFKSARSLFLETLFRNSPDIYEQLAKSVPEDDHLRIAQGRVLAMQSDWAQAAEAYSAAMPYCPPCEAWYEYLATLLLAGKIDEYKAFISRPDVQQAADEDPFIAYCLSRSVALCPSTVFSPDRMASWEKTMMDSPNPPHWYHHVSNLVRYRLGRHAEAIEVAKQDPGDANFEVLNNALLAVGYQQSGNRELAQNSLQLAIDGLAKIQDSIPIPDWLEFHLLLREAESLINEKE